MHQLTRDLAAIIAHTINHSLWCIFLDSGRFLCSGGALGHMGEVSISSGPEHLPGWMKSGFPRAALPKTHVHMSTERGRGSFWRSRLDGKISCKIMREIKRQVHLKSIFFSSSSSPLSGVWILSDCIKIDNTNVQNEPVPVLGFSDFGWMLWRERSFF